MEQMQKESLGKLGAWLGVAGNTLLIAIKLAAGVWGGSQGLVAEAIHSSADLLSSIGVLIGVRIANLPPDSSHPYGHGKAESIAATAVSIILILTGFELAYSGVMGIIHGTEVVPEPVTLWIALFTVIYNEVLFRYRLNIGKKINSPAIISDAWHQRADVFACIAVTLGIIGARLGFPILDPAAATVVSFFVVKAGWDLVKDAIGQLMDSSADRETNQKIMEILQNHTEVKEIEGVRTRSLGNGLHVELKYRVESCKTVEDAHRIAMMVKTEIQTEIPEVKDVTAHYGPSC